jgi:hypothetical protein
MRVGLHALAFLSFDDGVCVKAAEESRQKFISQAVVTAVAALETATFQYGFKI